MFNILQTLAHLLQKDQRLTVDGNLAKNKIIELAGPPIRQRPFKTSAFFPRNQANIFPRSR